MKERMRLSNERKEHLTRYMGTNKQTIWGKKSTSVLILHSGFLFSHLPSFALAEWMGIVIITIIIINIIIRNQHGDTSRAKKKKRKNYSSCSNSLFSNIFPLFSLTMLRFMHTIEIMTTVFRCKGGWIERTSCTIVISELLERVHAYQAGNESIPQRELCSTENLIWSQGLSYPTRLFPESEPENGEDQWSVWHRAALHKATSCSAKQQ